MNDIEVLENIINRCEKCKLPECINCEISWNEVQALENLIKGYRELEEENRIFALAGSNIALKLHVEKNYIPKSKIKEKIEELKKYRDIAKELIEEKVVIADSDSLNYGRAEAHDKDIQVLEELLKGE